MKATDRDYALSLDAKDPLAKYKSQFVITDPDLCYLDGNSLGRLPKKTIESISNFLTKEWGPEIVTGWSHWVDEAQPTGDLLGVAALGAAAGFGLALTFIAIGSQSSALLTMVSMRVATFFVTISLAIKFKTTGNFSSKEMPTLIFIGAADFLANLLLGILCSKGLVSVAMVFGSLFPIATALLAYKFLHERLLKIQYVGIALAVIGVSIMQAFNVKS